MRKLKYALLISVMGFLLQGCSSETQTNAPSDDGAAPNATQTAGLVVHIPDAEPYQVAEIPIEKAVSVRDLMLKAKEIDSKFQFRDTLYATMGHLLTSIQAIPNSKGEGAYWQFCVANTASDRGIDEKMVAPGQLVDWHFVQYGELPCKKIGE